MPDENADDSKPEEEDLAKTAAYDVAALSARTGSPAAAPTEPPPTHAFPPDVGPEPRAADEAAPHDEEGVELTEFDQTVNLTGDSPFFQQLQERLTNPLPTSDVTRSHLKGLLEALVFASDSPQKASDLAKAASAPAKEVRDLLAELRAEYQPRGIQLDEIAGGFLFRTSSAYAPFVRDLTKQKPVRLSRAQVETLAILAYRQPVTRPEIDEIRGVDSGPVLKLLLERDLVRILGKKDEPGRPMIYGTTTAFLEFFGLKSLKDLPTLREFTELTEDSRRVAERELGEVLESAQPEGAGPPLADGATEGLGEEPSRPPPREEYDAQAHDTLAPGPDLGDDAHDDEREREHQEEDHDAGETDKPPPLDSTPSD